MNCNMKRLFTSDIEAVSKCIGTNERNERVILPSNLYGRITRISHSACGENGTLLSTFEQRRLPEDVEDRLKRQQGHPVFRSDDGGKTWSLSARIINEEHPDLLTYFMPTIYELPRDVGAFPRGTLLMGGGSGGAEDGSYLQLYVSKDTGRSWKMLGTLDHGGWIGKGVWEPFFVLLDDNTLVCHYCDERQYKTHSQKLVYRTTKDLCSWSMLHESVKCSQQSLRPGMPVVTRLPDGRYFMAYEMVEKAGNPVHCRYSLDRLDWGEVTDEGCIVQTEDGASLGSSPYCLWVERGSVQGTLIVSGAFMSNGQSDTGSDYFLSDDLGQTWHQWPHPIPYSQQDHASHNGYSNSYAFSEEDNRFYAICNRGIQCENRPCTAMTVAVCEWGI